MVALTNCERKKRLGPKLNRCIKSVERQNIKKGCPKIPKDPKPKGRCVNPISVCRASVSGKVCPIRKKRKSN